MIKVAKALKEEVVRLARKEAKVAAGRMHRPAVKVKKAVAGLKRRVALLERTLRQLQHALKKMPSGQASAAAPEPAGRVRITGKGMRSLRRTLRLSQSDFARLIGVTPQSVYLWERKSGAIRARQATRAAVLSVRGIGAREAKRRLAEAKPAKASSRR
jgi:DNA-binding transcriptional regulator YiaG